jgi:hypothetical protein
MSAVRRPFALAFAAAALFLGPAHLFAQSRDLNAYALFALTGMRTKGLNVVRGELGVNDGAFYLNSHGDLDAPQSDLAAKIVRIPLTARCKQVYAAGTVATGSGCPQGAPFHQPYVDADAVTDTCGFPEPFPDCSHDPADGRTVIHDSTMALAAGTYGDVVVQGGGPGPAKLVLLGGNYTFCSLRAFRGATIRFDAPVAVRVLGDVLISNGTYTGPTLVGGAPSFSPLAAELFVQGSRVRFSRRARVKAKLCAPRARLQVAQGSDLEGSFVARTIYTDRIDARTPAPTPSTTTTTTTTTRPSTTRTTTTTRPTTTTTTIPANHCGDGVVNFGEACDPVAATDPCGAGMACGAAGSPEGCTCVALEICGDCADNDGDGLVDFEDADCCPRAESYAMTASKGRLKPRGATTKLKLRSVLAQSGLAGIKPLSEDVFLQIRGGDGTELLCAQVPAGKFKAKRRVFKFADRKHRVATARGLDRVKLKIRKDGSVRYRAFGKRVQMNAPTAGNLRVTVAFRNATQGDTANRCSTAVQAFRTGSNGKLIVP